MFPVLLYTFFITSVKYSTETTVRKYENFSAIQILREIKLAKFVGFQSLRLAKYQL